MAFVRSGRAKFEELIFPILIFVAVSAADAQDAVAFFRQNCTSCHTIGGGRLVGPDLKDVTAAAMAAGKDRSWLESFIQDPQTVLGTGDPYALRLQSEARGAVMAKVNGMTPAIAKSMIDLIEAESKLPKSQFVGMQISDRPYTAADVAQGLAIFRGETALLNRGAPCISCHTINGVGGLGGGRLAPDLTKVFERLGGRKPMATWLSAPPTPTMNPVFKKHPLDSAEILPLIALCEDAAKRGGTGGAPTTMFNFLLYGLGGTVLVLLLFDLLWNRRFRAVRRPMVLGLDGSSQK